MPAAGFYIPLSLWERGDLQHACAEGGDHGIYCGITRLFYPKTRRPHSCPPATRPSELDVMVKLSRRLCFPLPALWLALGLAGMNSAHADEYDKKAEYLVKTSDYVDNWPRSATLTLCVLGPDPFGDRLDDAVRARKRADGRKLEAKRIAGNPHGAGCQVVFVSKGAGDAAEVAKKSGKGILTVSDAQNFAKNGGMVNFVMEGAHVRFEINEGAVKAAGIRLSAQFYQLARKLY